MSEKMRVHILAKELNVPSKTILVKCRAEGLDNVVKNHMSTLSAGLYATIKEWFSEGRHSTAVETSASVDLKKVRVKPKRKTQRKTVATEEAAPPDGAVPGAAVAVAEVETVASVLDETAEDAAPGAQAAVAGAIAPEVTSDTAEVTGAGEADTALTEGLVETTIADIVSEVTEKAAVSGEAAQAQAEAPAAKAKKTAPRERAPAGADSSEQEEAGAAGPQNVPKPLKLKGPRVVRYEAPDPIAPPRRPLPRGPQEVGDRQRDALPRESTVVPKGPGKHRAQTVVGRGKSRVNPRRTVGRLNEASERLKEWRDRDLAERQERLAGATGRRIHRRRSTQPAQHAAPTGPKTKAKVHEPIRMKEFCAETGLNFIQCFKILRSEHNIIASMNMTLPTETAQLLALELGIDLEVVPAKTLLDVLQEEFEKIERQNLQPRPPVVTMLGHVDHGKTSLLDVIRHTRVAAGEDGGITQHIGAYHLETEHGTVTFLDTPGHEAFTAMRARGAALTDVVVLVVAADDGLMPQTLEAINHAKSAEVSIVVALNKIDLGEQNVVKIFSQLSEQGLTPSGEWGGEVDVIRTSATTGEGIEELVEHLSHLTELLDLKADPDLPACGTVIESETKTGVGAAARVLVQEGTLKVGDVVVCGPSFGKVRALVDDQSRRLKKAGPSMPVEIWGLDTVPNSGDKFYCIDNLQRAASIADEVKQSRLASGRQQSRKVTTLEQMFEQRAGDEIPELNVIIKADVDGSVQMLQETLGRIPTAEVRLSVRHAGVGEVNDSDVLLAAACKGIVVAYRVDTPVGVRRLADREGVEIRTYRVVYNASDDIKKALEGLLAPEEHLETRSTAEVRSIFRITKLGVVAGCLVTDGVANRNHLARVLRDGVIVREGCKVGSLRRFKDDAKEVRAGMECGIRLRDFDDVHEGDVIETYEVVKIARTL